MATSVSPARLTFGLSLIALGVVWLLANLEIIDLGETLRTWWPLVFVLWGALDLVRVFLDRSSGSTQ